jgi:hypothetical protein
MDPREELIHENTQLVLEQLGPQSGIDFGLNGASVEWVEEFIERQRARPNLDPAAVDRLMQVLGSFLGDCIVAATGGVWQWSPEHGAWLIRFPDDSAAFPFNKVRKLFANGREGGDSIASFYRVTVDYVAKGKLGK